MTRADTTVTPADMYSDAQQGKVFLRDIGQNNPDVVIVLVNCIGIGVADAYLLQLLLLRSTNSVCDVCVDLR